MSKVILRPDPSREFIQAIEVLGKTVFEINEMYRIRLLIWWDRDGLSTVELEGNMPRCVVFSMRIFFASRVICFAKMIAI